MLVVLCTLALIFIPTQARAVVEHIVVTSTTTLGSLQNDVQFLSDFTPVRSYSIGPRFRAHLMRGMQGSNLKALQQHQSVVYVEENAEVHALAPAIQPNPPSWGLRRVSQRALPLPTSYKYDSTAGQGVTVYVVDTGIYCDHNDFVGRCKFGFVSSDLRSEGEGAEDCNGHGTHCAGTVGGTEYGVAKLVDLVAVKVLGCSGSGSYDGIIEGFEWIVNQYQSNSNPSVVSLSLGGSMSQALNAAMDAMSEAGLVNAVAAGNDYFVDACTKSPASASSAFTVASATSSDNPSPFTNLGTCVNIWAPGSDINSTWIGVPDAWKVQSGTSMATPHVAGVMALFMAEGPRGRKDVNQMVLDLATPDVINYETQTKTPFLVQPQRAALQKQREWIPYRHTGTQGGKALAEGEHVHELQGTAASDEIPAAASSLFEPIFARDTQLARFEDCRSDDDCSGVTPKCCPESGRCIMSSYSCCGTTSGCFSTQECCGFGNAASCCQKGSCCGGSTESAICCTASRTCCTSDSGDPFCSASVLGVCCGDESCSNMEACCEFNGEKFCARSSSGGSCCGSQASQCQSYEVCCPGSNPSCVWPTFEFCCGEGSCRNGEICCNDDSSGEAQCCPGGWECLPDGCYNPLLENTPNLNLFSHP